MREGFSSSCKLFRGNSLLPKTIDARGGIPSLTLKQMMNSDITVQARRNCFEIYILNSVKFAGYFYVGLCQKIKCLKVLIGNNSSKVEN